MTLSLEDGKLFFDLMWRLQFCVSQKLGIQKNVSSWGEYASLTTKKKIKVRDEVWKNSELIEAYIQENPDALSADELGIIRNWKGYVKGSFFIFRHLKRGSIFIGKDDQVYAVHGIQDPLDEVIPSYALPQMVEAILLPFKGQIIYDGLLSGYRIHFGGGIRSNLNHTYKVAKQKGRIISTLEPDLVSPKPQNAKKNNLPHLKQLYETMNRIKGNSPLQNSALALSRACLELSLADAEGVLISDEVEIRVRKLRRAASRLLNLLDIVEEE